MRRQPAFRILVTHFVAICAALVLAEPSAAQTVVFINELHYDNAGADQEEFVEVAGPAGTDLTGWTVALYNGSTGLVYDTIYLGGTIPEEQAGYGTLSFLWPGIQNGSPDGLALVDDLSQAVQFLSYEGAFVALDGPAVGWWTSIDIGVAEESTTAIGHSLSLVGVGGVYEDFSWSTPAANTRGSVNYGQTFQGGSGGRIFEDGFASGDLSAWSDAAGEICDFHGGAGCSFLSKTCFMGEILNPQATDLCLGTPGVIPFPLPEFADCDAAGLSAYDFCGPNSLCLETLPGDLECRDICATSEGPFGSSHPDCRRSGAVCTDAFMEPGYGLCE